MCENNLSGSEMAEWIKSKSTMLSIQYFNNMGVWIVTASGTHGKICSDSKESMDDALRKMVKAIRIKEG